MRPMSIPEKAIRWPRFLKPTPVQVALAFENDSDMKHPNVNVHK